MFLHLTYNYLYIKICLILNLQSIKLNFYKIYYEYIYATCKEYKF